MIKTNAYKLMLALAILLAAVALCIYFYNYGSPFYCVWYKTFHSYCPGCGAGRAIHSLLHFKIIDAISYNALFVLIFPFAGYYLLMVFLLWTLNIKIPFFKIKKWMGYGLCIIIVVFTICRNIDVYPFNILSP